MPKISREIELEILEDVIYSPIGKYYCTKCKNRMATWMYAPASDRWEEADRYYCSDCVSRGCSCRLLDFDDPDPNGEQERSPSGKLLPCIEYYYDETGFKIDE